MDRDPTKTSAALVQLRRQIEALLCQGHDHLPNCSCKKIQELYGTNLYRCDRQFCQFYSTGFATRRERDVHLKVHSRPYLCPHTDCLFTELGFKSSPELARHCKEAHPPQRRIESRVVSAELIQQVSENDMKALIEDAVRHDETDAVSYLLQNFNYTSHEYWSLHQLAATHASGNMVRCILYQAQKIDKELDIETGVLAAIRGENMLTLQYLVIKADQIMSQKFDTSRRKRILTYRVRCAFEMGNADIMDILINDGRLELPSTCPNNLFRELIISKRDDTEKVRRLRSMKKYVIWPEAFTNAVYWAALTGSIIMLQGCLDCGGSANAVVYRSSGDRSFQTALHQCVRKGTNRHAEVVKLLLQNGADPNAKAGLTRLKGIAKIEKYFGVSWEDLVIQTQGHTDHKLTDNSFSPDSSTPA
ncbi:uncharacterized protein BDW43DRAFT_227897 [Aspergillus alliaceus]|uniref:uncharacterized protein n=1 Tax=Petromyces alliaceus TaxID=209559 RepID=UPI0012A61081|nr:uncharacterized protein BDW43DRAFT_227897 [Aspergillus alliaceus]KAB8236917.1 hypothetical protein BDW43DRAFT_227897 [Aspergillus alliaceus]